MQRTDAVKIHSCWHIPIITEAACYTVILTDSYFRGDESPSTMVRVLVDMEMVSKVPLSLVAQAASELRRQVHDDLSGAKKKCEKVVAWDGVRIALICKYNEQDDTIYITKARLLGKSKKSWRI